MKAGYLVCLGRGVVCGMVLWWLQFPQKEKPAKNKIITQNKQGPSAPDDLDVEGIAQRVLDVPDMDCANDVRNSQAMKAASGWRDREWRSFIKEARRCGVCLWTLLIQLVVSRKMDQSGLMREDVAYQRYFNVLQCNKSIIRNK